MTDLGLNLLTRSQHIAAGLDPADFTWCPVCETALISLHGGLWCTRCHLKVEGCCEGAPQQ